jgi:cell wall-associated NlpC family hydrolase
MMAWKAGGVSLPHNAAAQYSTVKHVAYNDLQPGDLVFFQGLGHMGMYVGGEKMIHAPHTGTVVQIVSIAPGTSYNSRFLAGGRP